MSTLIQNPNHIGCHTLGHSERHYRGTQSIEKELLDICAIDIIKGEHYGYDGYVASGGTEANIQAIWVYRNYFMNTCAKSKDEIALLCSKDSHYFMDKVVPRPGKGACRSCKRSRPRILRRSILNGTE